jgi:integrase
MSLPYAYPQGTYPMKLTKANMTAIEAAFAASGKADKTYFDDSLPGFGLRLRISGHRAWVVHYERGGIQRKLTLGTPAILAADEARFLARRHLSEATLGRDPQAEKAEERAKARVTLRGVAEQYLRFKQSQLRPKSLRDARYYLLQTWKPLHCLPVHKIARRDVAVVLSDVAENAPVAAARARSNLSALFAWAIGEGLTESNPVVGTNNPAKNVARDRVLTDTELAAVWGACGDDTSGHIVKLLILTGQRREEVGGLSWGELDRFNGTWTLPASRTKNRREHILTLPGMAWSIIEQVPRREVNDHLFGRSARGFDNWHKAKTLLDQRCRIAPWRLHDLRRTVATRMADIGIKPHIIEAVLNHVSGHKAGVAGVYNRSAYTHEVRNALAAWADHVRQITTGVAPTVISMERIRPIPA